MANISTWTLSTIRGIVNMSTSTLLAIEHNKTFSDLQVASPVICDLGIAYFWWIEGVVASHGPYSSNIINRDYLKIEYT
jgi:hypothetical protein